MCGIVSVFHYAGQGTIDRDALVEARDTMRARGPDDSGLWTDNAGRVGLAHRRLAVLDLSSRGSQPMEVKRGTYRISHNGEIYNYQSLRNQLEAKGYEFRTHTDTEVLLYLYCEVGSDLVQHVRGMYAFALWDSEREGLLLARDPYGIKPLYVADDGATLRAASQVKALQKFDDIDTSRDPAGHVGYFLWGHVPEPHTLYLGIRAVPAGSTLWVDRHGTESQSFASVRESLIRAEEAGRSIGRSSHKNTVSSTVNVPAEVDDLHEILLDSIRHHLVADVDVGLFLSAGVDSGALVALAAEVTEGLRTITLGFSEFRGTGEDEVPGAERIAERYGTEHKTVWVSREDFIAAQEDFFAAMDQPTINGINSYFVSRVAREAGLKVAISGLGGDEIFGGYPSFTQIPFLVNTTRLVPGARSIGKGLRAVAAPVIGRMTSPKYAGLVEYGTDYGGAYLLRRALFMPWELPDLLGAEFVRAGWSELQMLSRLRETVRGIENNHLRVTSLESSWYMRNQLLRDIDWASMAHGLEVRTPLVDWALLHRIAPIVAAQGTSKNNLARAPHRPLPKQTVNRPKSGFTVPIRQWLRPQEAWDQEAQGVRAWAKYVYDRCT